MNDTTNQEMLPKRQAAQLMGISTRRVLELASQGVLRRVQVKDPASRQTIVMVPRADCIAYVDSFKKPANPDVLTGKEENPPVSYDAGDWTRALPLLLEHLAPRRRPGWQWLTLHQAAEESGLPASYLRGLIQSERLPAIDVGLQRGGRLRIRRSDLQAIGVPKAIAA